MSNVDSYFNLLEEVQALEDAGYSDKFIKIITESYDENNLSDPMTLDEYLEHSRKIIAAGDDNDAKE